MWEPEDRDLGRARTASFRVRNPGTDNALELPSNRDATSRLDRVWPLPPELLILTRYGVSRRCLETVWKISVVTGTDGREYLLSTGIITREIWRKSQALLQYERHRRHRKPTQRDRQIDNAVNALNAQYPNYSARKTFSSWQLWTIAGLALITLQGAFFDFQNLIVVFIVLASLFYAGVIAARLAFLAWYDRRLKIKALRKLDSNHQCPLYSILVPLLREADQVNGLVRHLEALDWPKQKLEVKLLCEKDDKATIAAIGKTKLAPCFELVIVPPIGPRTKPKALNFGLPLCKGDYVVVYDAEDRPGSGQLKEAWYRFSTAEKQLACLQAPLMINNSRQTWLSYMFFLEYLVLFLGILPILACWKAPIPLGGSSNHFRRDILVSLGAWDPFNVTEDADLGIRLFREGYRCSTLRTVTFEEAPPHFSPWFKQRTRWMKGWMQTLLVHNRTPLTLFKEMGFKNTLIFHLILTSIVFSTLIHPFFVFTLVFSFAGLEQGVFKQPLITGYGFFCLLISYLSYALLAHLTIRDELRTYKPLMLFTIPIYWLLVSLAAWRGLFHLIVIPHHWEKTPHGLANNRDRA